MRRVGLLATVAILAALSGPGGARAATSPSVLDVSWWTRVPGETAPSGGLAVGTAPDGPTSVAALHLDLTSGGVSGARLQLTEASGSLGGQAAAVRVCVTAASWQSAQGGALANAATTTCGATGVDMTSDGNGGWSAGLDGILGAEHDIVGLAIVPGPAQSPAFDLRFGPPVFTATAKGGAGSGSDAPVTAVDTVPTDSGYPGLGGGPVTGSDYQPVVVPDQGPTSATTAPPAVFGPSVSGDRAAVPLRVVPSSHSRGHPYGKAFLYIIISLMVGSAAGLGRRFNLPFLKGRTS